MLDLVASSKKKLIGKGTSRQGAGPSGRFLMRVIRAAVKH